MYRLDKIKEYEISSPINSASLHPDQQVFVCGGEDFKMYKCDFTTGAELGNAIFTACLYANVRLNIDRLFTCI